MEHINERKFLESYSASTEVVPEVVTKLMEDLEALNLPKEERDEIILSMDEAITNAIQETLRKNQDTASPSASKGHRDITIRYILNDEEFEATIIDHGKGLDIFNIIKDLPDCSSCFYENQIIGYATESERNKIKITLNGKQVPVKGIGAGLKIILNFMDNVTIDLIDREKIISDSVSSHTDGTIFNMRRNRRY